MESSEYWQRGSGPWRTTRRRVLAGSGAGAAALFLAACSGSSSKKGSSTTGNAGAATQATVPASSGSVISGAPLTATAAVSGSRGNPTSPIYLDAKSKPVTGKETIEELRERFHPRQLKYLPAWKNNPKSGGTLRWFSDMPTSWDFADAAASLLASYAMFHNGLMTFEMGDLSDNLNLVKTELDLAQSYEQTDEMTLTFKLKPNVKWQNVAPVNGRPFTAEDVKYCTEVYQKAPVQSTIYRDVDRVEVPDASTVVYKMKQPVAYLLNVLRQPHNLIFSREQHDSPDGLKSGPIGTGAFIFTGGTLHVGWKARKNPDYFKKDKWTGQQLPYLDGIETLYAADANAQVAGVRSKQVDVYGAPTRNIWMDLLKTNPELVTQITTPPPSYQPFIGIRNDKPPFNDPRVRQAMSLAIDRQAIIDTVFFGMAGYGYAQDWTYFGQEWPWTPDQVGQYMQFDPKKAKQLLSAAGLGNGIGRKMELYHVAATGYNFDTGQLVADNWQRNLGIDVTQTTPPDYASWVNKLYNVQYDDAIVVGVAGPSLDPDAYSFDPLNSKSTKNYFKVNDPQLDQLTQAQRVEFDVPKRQGILRDIMARDLDQAYRMWTVTQYKINARFPYLYNAVDQVHAWGPAGWGSKVCELIWMDK